MTILHQNPAIGAGRPGVGIFLDAENLLHFLKNDGASKLVQIALKFGNPVLMELVERIVDHASAQSTGIGVSAGSHFAPSPRQKCC